MDVAIADLRRSDEFTMETRRARSCFVFYPLSVLRSSVVTETVSCAAGLAAWEVRADNDRSAALDRQRCDMSFLSTFRSPEAYPYQFCFKIKRPASQRPEAMERVSEGQGLLPRQML